MNMKKPKPVKKGYLTSPGPGAVGFGTKPPVAAPQSSGTAGFASSVPPPSAPAAPATTPATPGLPPDVVDTSQPPPPTADSQTARINADAAYTGGLTQPNYDLWQTAFDYGGAPSVTQYGYTPGGRDSTQRLLEGTDTTSQLNVGQNDNSQLATLRRQLGLDSIAQDEAANKANSFFSGANLEGHGRLNATEGRGETSALETYNAAIQRLNSAILAAQGTRHGAYRDANTADFDAAARATPVAEAPIDTPPAPPTPGTPVAIGQSVTGLTDAQKAGMAAMREHPSLGAPPPPLHHIAPSKKPTPVKKKK